MNTRKSMKLPIVITFIFICIIVYLFMNIKQSVVECNKTTVFDSNIQFSETVTAKIDGKKISSLTVYKKVVLPDKFSHKEENLNAIKNSLSYTLDYLGDRVTYFVSDNSVIALIEIENGELVLLDNVSFSTNGDDISIKINSNTKSSEVVALSVGDNYTDGEFMMRLKNNGYSCK